MAMMGAIIQINEHWNEDFLEYNKNMEGPGSVSNFWEGLVIKNYGSSKEKSVYKERQRSNGSTRNNVSWKEHDI